MWHGLSNGDDTGFATCHRCHAKGEITIAPEINMRCQDIFVSGHRVITKKRLCNRNTYISFWMHLYWFLIYFLSTILCSLWSENSYICISHIYLTCLRWDDIIDISLPIEMISYDPTTTSIIHIFHWISNVSMLICYLKCDFSDTDFLVTKSHWDFVIDHTKH